jgi:hypothetical protein
LLPKMAWDTAGVLANSTMAGYPLLYCDNSPSCWFLVCSHALRWSSTVADEAEDKIIEAVRRSGWSERALAVVRLNWEFEKLPVDERTVEVRLQFAVQMLKTNGESYEVHGGWSPEPLQQLQTAVEEHAAGLPQLFFPKTPSTSEARAYSADIRERIYATAAALVTRLHKNGTKKKNAEKIVADLLASFGFTSASGGIAEGVAGLRKQVRSAELGRAPFQAHYDMLMRYAPPASGQSDTGLEKLIGIITLLCNDYRLFPHSK